MTDTKPEHTLTTATSNGNLSKTAKKKEKDRLRKAKRKQEEEEETAAAALLLSNAVVPPVVDAPVAVAAEVEPVEEKVAAVVVPEVEAEVQEEVKEGETVDTNISATTINTSSPTIPVTAASLPSPISTTIPVDSTPVVETVVEPVTAPKEEEEKKEEEDKAAAPTPAEIVPVIAAVVAAPIVVAPVVVEEVASIAIEPIPVAVVESKSETRPSPPPTPVKAVVEAVAVVPEVIEVPVETTPVVVAAPENVVAPIVDSTPAAVIVAPTPVTKTKTKSVKSVKSVKAPSVKKSIKAGGGGGGFASLFSCCFSSSNYEDEPAAAKEKRKGPEPEVSTGSDYSEKQSPPSINTTTSVNGNVVLPEKSTPALPPPTPVSAPLPAPIATAPIPIAAGAEADILAAAPSGTKRRRRSGKNKTVDQSIITSVPEPGFPQKQQMADAEEGDDYEDGESEEDESEEEDEELMLIAKGGVGIPVDADGNLRPLLQPLEESSSLFGRKCLVLDLDETLVHSSFKMIHQADYVVPVEIENQYHNVYVIKRPGVDEFLRAMGEVYEIVIFTASLSKYADPVLDQLDIHKVVKSGARLFRESCYNNKGNYVKDLSQLGRPISECIIIDNSPASYVFHPNNAVPISSWFNDPHDTELTDLIPFLTDLARIQDVRQVLDAGLYQTLGPTSDGNTSPSIGLEKLAL